MPEALRLQSVVADAVFSTFWSHRSKLFPVVIIYVFSLDYFPFCMLSVPTVNCKDLYQCGQIMYVSVLSTIMILSWDKMSTLISACLRWKLK